MSQDILGRFQDMQWLSIDVNFGLTFLNQLRIMTYMTILKCRVSKHDHTGYIYLYTEKNIWIKLIYYLETNDKFLKRRTFF